MSGSLLPCIDPFLVSEYGGLVKLPLSSHSFLRAGSLILAALWLFVALGPLHLCLCGSCAEELSFSHGLEEEVSVPGNCCAGTEALVETLTSDVPSCELVSACNDCVELELAQLPSTQLSSRMLQAPPALLSPEDLFLLPIPEPSLAHLERLQRQRPPDSLFPQEQIHILRI